MNPGERTQATDLVRELVEHHGFLTLRVSVSTGRHIILTLDADPGPVTMEDCTTMNRAIRRGLEEAGLPADDYSIEVESPGVRRILSTERHFERFAGERAKVVLAEPTADGQTVVRGVIERVAAGKIRLKPDHGRPYDLDLAEIDSANLDPRY